MDSVEELVREAQLAMEQSYSPYSEYAVGAAVETDSGDVFHGCNVENAAYTPTTHAEQTAVVSAIASGATSFNKLAIVTSNRDGGAPCGFCRQFLREFVDDDFVVYSATEAGYEEYVFGELLPDSFDPVDVLGEAVSGTEE